MRPINFLLLMLCFTICQVHSLICYDCHECHGSPKQFSRGKVCMIHNSTCSGSYRTGTILNFQASSSNILCGATSKTSVSTVDGNSIWCSGTWSCCYSDYCNKCPPGECNAKSIESHSWTDHEHDYNSVNKIHGWMTLTFMLPMVTIILTK